MNTSIRPAYWHQGLFLQPHHFQYQELFLQSQMKQMAAGISPFPWGVRSLSFRSGALDEQIVELTGGTLTFQDGSTVVIPETAALQPRSFKDIAERITSGEPLGVYLALRRMDLSGKNVATITKETNLNQLRTRFITDSDAENAANLYEGGDSASIGFMKYLVKIIWKSELEEYGDYHCLPVASIVLASDTYQYAQEFIPPVMSLRDSPALMNLIRDIQDALLSRSKILELYKISRPMRAEDFEGNYLRYLEALRAINQFTPLIQHIIESPHTHPWTLYGQLRQLIGGLSTFTDRINALGKLANGMDLVHPYCHEDTRSCFGEVKLLLRELLNSIIVGEDNVVELTRDNACFHAALPSEAFDRKNIVCLMLRATGETDAILNSLLHHAKLGPERQMDTIVSRALDGVAMEYMETPPPGIPVHPDGYVFKLQRSGHVWDDVQREGGICLYWDEAGDDAVGEIIISRK